MFSLVDSQNSRTFAEILKGIDSRKTALLYELKIFCLLTLWLLDNYAIVLEDFIGVTIK